MFELNIGTKITVQIKKHFLVRNFKKKRKRRPLNFSKSKLKKYHQTNSRNFKTPPRISPTSSAGESDCIFRKSFSEIGTDFSARLEWLFDVEKWMFLFHFGDDSFICEIKCSNRVEQFQWRPLNWFWHSLSPIWAPVIRKMLIIRRTCALRVNAKITSLLKNCIT